MINKNIIFMSLLLPSLALAETDSWLAKDKININIGAFITEYDGTGRVTSSSTGLGTKISFEDDLGLEDSNSVVRLDTSFRISERHSVQFTYIDLTRDGDSVTDRPLIIDNTIYPVGSRLDSEFEYRVYKFAYTYSIWQTSGYDLGFTTGLHIFEVDLNIDSDVAEEEGDGGTAPFPMFGLRGTWELAPRLFVRANIEYFKISEGDIDGSLTDYLLSVEYRFEKPWGVGIGFNHLDLDVENTEERDELSYQYDGILLYANLRF